MNNFYRRLTNPDACWTLAAAFISAIGIFWPRMLDGMTGGNIFFITAGLGILWGVMFLHTFYIVQPTDAFRRAMECFVATMFLLTFVAVLLLKFT